MNGSELRFVCQRRPWQLMAQSTLAVLNEHIICAETTVHVSHARGFVISLLIAATTLMKLRQQAAQVRWTRFP